MNLKIVNETLLSLADPDIAAHSQRFFKTEIGQYGHGDIFLGIRVPQLRKKAKEFKTLSLEDTLTLIHSPYHEARLMALFILIQHFEKGDKTAQDIIYKAYLENTRSINNWDLVDSSAPNIVGAYLYDKDKSILFKMARSNDLWEKRIAIMATFYFIKEYHFDEALKIAAILIHDSHDLIHKAVGWMLREIGNRDRLIEENFLLSVYTKMPRTMLRYAIEKFPEELRKKYLKGEL